MFNFSTFGSCFEKGAFFKLQNFTLISNDKSQSSVLDRAGVCLVPEDSVQALLRNPSICHRESRTYSGSSFSSISFFLPFFFLLYSHISLLTHLLYLVTLGEFPPDPEGPSGSSLVGAAEYPSSIPSSSSW